MKSIITLALVASISLTVALEPVDLAVSFDETFSDFKVSISGVEWLHSGPTGIRDGGQWWASNNKDKYLLKVEKHSTETGVDVLGTFNSTM